ncbi:MAG: hypothetical protein JW760_11690 [Spirochaetales bacterium]|nr:hypothetical protein [Spirochaetales bacterium]
MKKVILVLLFGSISLSLFPQEKPSLSVLDFRGSGISEAEVYLFVDFVTSHIISSGQYRVIDRSQRQTILKEIEFSYEGCTDEACQLEIGRLLSARYIVIGSLGKIGGQYLMTMKLLDVETGEALRSVSEVYATMDNLVNDSKRVACLVLGKNSSQEPQETAQAPEEASENNQEQPPVNPTIPSDYPLNAAGVTGYFEFEDEEPYIGLVYMLMLTPRIGMDIELSLSLDDVDFCGVLGVLYDFGRVRAVLNIGFDTYAELVINPMIALELGRFLLIFRIGIDTYGMPTIGAGAAWMF